MDIKLKNWIVETIIVSGSIFFVTIEIRLIVVNLDDLECDGSLHNNVTVTH